MKMISLDNFQELLRRVEQVRRETDQELGAIQERRRQLEEQYGTSDLEELRAKRQKLHARMMKRSEAYLAKKQELEDILARRPNTEA